MKRIKNLHDLSDYGISPLTGEACGLMHRILCDVDEDGLKALKMCFGCKFELSEAWNQGVGSIMLPPRMWMDIGIYCLLVTGCICVYERTDGLWGADDQEDIDKLSNFDYVRSYMPRGTSDNGDRNVHVISGRVT